MLERHASLKGWGIYCMWDLGPYGCRHGRVFFGLSYWPRRPNTGSPFLGVQSIHDSLNTSRLTSSDSAFTHHCYAGGERTEHENKGRVQLVALWVFCKPCWSFLNIWSGKTSLKKVLSCEKLCFIYQPLVLKLTLLPFYCKTGFFNHYSIKKPVRSIPVPLTEAKHFISLVSI